MPRPTRLALAATLAASLGGCTEYSYFERRETLALGAGDAMAANRAIHTIDPWPRRVADTAIEHDGVRMARAVDRYRRHGDDEDKGAPVTLQLPIAPGSAR